MLGIMVHEDVVTAVGLVRLVGLVGLVGLVLVSFFRSVS